MKLVFQIYSEQQGKGVLMMTRYVAVVGLATVTVLAGCGTNHLQTVDVPAYRPPSNGGAETSFRDDLGETSITVFPTLVRDPQGNSYSHSSRTTIAEFFETEKLATVVESDNHVDFSAPAVTTQHDLFQQNMSLFAEYLGAEPVTTEYALLVECLVTPTKSGGEAVGGVQCYLLDAKGHNAFSFLMNSHHCLFNEAGLKTETASDDARAALIDGATDIVIEALRRQLQPELLALAGFSDPAMGWPTVLAMVQLFIRKSEL
jgi:hypothetical protein